MNLPLPHTRMSSLRRISTRKATRHLSWRKKRYYIGCSGSAEYRAGSGPNLIPSASYYSTKASADQSPTVNSAHPANGLPCAALGSPVPWRLRKRGLRGSLILGRFSMFPANIPGSLISASELSPPLSCAFPLTQRNSTLISLDGSSFASGRKKR